MSEREYFNPLRKIIKVKVSVCLGDLTYLIFIKYRYKRLDDVTQIQDE